MNDEQRRRFGGSAFPLSTNRDYERGMTILDYFAAHALTGILAFSPPDAAAQCSPDVAAETAYVMAAAMLAERRKRLANEKPQHDLGGEG